MIPTMNKPTRVTRNRAAAIDHIITNTVKSGTGHRSSIKKLIFQIVLQLSLHLKHVKNVSQKIRNNLFKNASREKNRQSYSSMN